MKAIIVMRIVAFLLIFFMCINAFANVKTFKRASGWEAWGGLSEDNRKLCGVSAEGGGRFFSVKYFQGDTHMTIHMSKNTWTAKRGAQVNIVMKFDDESPWKATATAFFMQDGDVGLQFNIPLERLKQWFAEFRRSNTLYVVFPDDNIDDWQADLAGTPDIANAMGECLDAMNKYTN